MGRGIRPESSTTQVAVVLDPEDFAVVAAMEARGVANSKAAALRRIVHLGLSALRAAAEAERVGDVAPSNAALAVLHAEAADEILIKRALDLINEALERLAAGNPGGALLLGAACESAFAQWVEEREDCYGVTVEELHDRQIAIAR